jgi:hypothetical protein
MKRKEHESSVLVFWIGDNLFKIMVLNLNKDKAWQLTTAFFNKNITKKSFLLIFPK